MDRLIERILGAAAGGMLLFAALVDFIASNSNWVFVGGGLGAIFGSWIGWRGWKDSNVQK
jgi:hypothetical protein